VSERNVELVRSVYDDWARGDFSEGEVFHPDIRFEMVDWPEGSSARGLEEMRRAWGEALSAWESFRAEPSGFIDGDDRVVVLTRVWARGRGSGIDLSADTATVWTIDAGRVVRLGLYWDPEKAFEAAGLKPPA
jgi:ketosteroid isomerase-like protein